MAYQSSLSRRLARSNGEQIYVSTSANLHIAGDAYFCNIALAVGCHDSDIRTVKALIVGPPESPYEFGFFEVCFLFYFGNSYV